MKKIMKTYFSADTVSAVFALLVFICTVFALISHLLIGAGAFAFSWSLCCALWAGTLLQPSMTKTVKN